MLSGMEFHNLASAKAKLLPFANSVLYLGMTFRSFRSYEVYKRCCFFFEKVDEVIWGSLIHNFTHKDRYMLSSSSLISPILIPVEYWSILHNPWGL